MEVAPGDRVILTAASVTGKNPGPRHVSRFGRHDLKVLLIECAQSAYRHGKLPVHKWARRLVGRRKLHNLGVVALTRKLAVYAWHLLMGHALHDGAEPDAGTLRKLAKLAGLLGREHLQTLGYATPGRSSSDFLGIFSTTVKKLWK